MRAATSASRVDVRRARAVAIREAPLTVDVDEGSSLSTGVVVVAGGAWSSALVPDLPLPRPAASLAFLLGAAVLALLVAWQAQDAKVAGIMVGGLAGLVLAAALAAWIVIAV